MEPVTEFSVDAPADGIIYRQIGKGRIEELAGPPGFELGTACTPLGSHRLGRQMDASPRVWTVWTPPDATFATGAPKLLMRWRRSRYGDVSGYPISRG